MPKCVSALQVRGEVPFAEASRWRGLVLHALVTSALRSPRAPCSRSGQASVCRDVTRLPPSPQAPSAALLSACGSGLSGCGLAGSRGLSVASCPPSVTPRLLSARPRPQHQSSSPCLRQGSSLGSSPGLCDTRCPSPAGALLGVCAGCSCVLRVRLSHTCACVHALA